MKKTIKVTEKHIRDGVPEDGTICPIGLALTEQLANGLSPIAHQSGIEIHRLRLEGSDVLLGEFPVPDSARTFMNKFDTRGVECAACNGEGVRGDFGASLAQVALEAQQGKREEECSECYGLGELSPYALEPFEFEIDLPDDCWKET